MVRPLPHQEYCMQLEEAHFKKDMDKLERVQQRVIDKIRGLENIIYE